MLIRNSAARYGLVSQLLHWSTVVLVVVQFVLAERAEEAASLLQKAQILTTHKSIGMTLLMLTVLRLTWRSANPVPPLPPAAGVWQRRFASWMHRALYALILLTPLAGWLMSSAKSYSVSWFGLFTFPDLVTPDEALHERLKALHGGLAGTIFLVAIVHLLAALKHHLIDKDNVLRRMLPMKLR